MNDDSTNTAVEPKGETAVPDSPSTPPQQQKRERGPAELLGMGFLICILFFPAFGGAKWSWSIVTGDGAFFGKTIAFVTGVASALFAILFAVAGPIFFLMGLVFVILWPFRKKDKSHAPTDSAGVAE